VHLDDISPCANPCCSKESQFLIEHQAAGSKEKLLINKERNKKAKQLRRRRIAQPPQDIHGRVVKKLETGETVASVKLHKKDVPKAINEPINMNKEKGKDSLVMLFALIISLCHPRAKREEKKEDVSSARN
jgi:hypothetical protein